MKDPRLDEPISTIYHLYNGRRRPGPDALVRHPEWTRRLLEELGRPDHSFPSIMVTGSKGKGSTAFYLARVLEAHGLSVGFFSGPHLVDNLERVRLNGRAISADEFLHHYAALKPALDRVTSRIPSDQYLGPVGAFAALAALYYRDRRVDVAVVETGRGARFDDVAEVHHEGAIITRVLLEHRRELGPTLGDIAWHKAGVVRPETRWVVAPRDPRLLPWIGETDAKWVPEASLALRGVEPSRSGLAFRVGRAPALMSGRLPALAPFAAENARRALVAAERWLGPRFDLRVALGALEWSRFPGRGDLLPVDPPTVLDGAIRRESARAVVEAVRAAGLDAGGVVSVVGVPADKDWRGVAATVSNLGPLLFAPARNPRLTFPSRPLDAFPTARAMADVPSAWELARTLRPGLVLALGTQSFVADLIEYLGLDAQLLDLGRAAAATASAR